MQARARLEASAWNRTPLPCYSVFSSDILSRDEPATGAGLTAGLTGSARLGTLTFDGLSRSVRCFNSEKPAIRRRKRSKAQNQKHKNAQGRRSSRCLPGYSSCLHRGRSNHAQPNRPWRKRHSRRRAANFDIPARRDCHTHIHGDPEKFPFFPGRVYTPEPASPEEMAALHKALHIERVVIVTPSVYGPDNSATLFGIKARGATARGVAVSTARPRTATSTP